MVAAASRRSGPDHLGIAVTAGELWVSYVGSRAEPVLRHMPLDAMAADGADWPALAQAFVALHEETGATRLSISLISPLAEIRVVELPPIRDDEAERVLARGAARYFVTARQPHLVGIVRRGRMTRGAPRRVVAAAAPTRLIALIHAAARNAGFAVDGIGPAEAAWCAAATSFWPAFERGTAFVAVAHAERTELLQLERGRLAAVRRFRAGALDAEIIAAAIRDEGAGQRARVAAFGARDQRSVLARALAAVGVTVTMPGDDGDAALNPSAIAAAFAAPASGPLFRTEDVRATTRGDAWRATRFVAAAALMLAMLGAAAQLWGVRRQLQAVRDQRASLAPRLSTTLAGRSSLEAAYRMVSALSVAQRGVPEWSRTLVGLSDAIPDDAYLTAFRTRGDSVIVEGLAVHASAVFDAMEQLPGLANVRAASPVRREVQDDKTALEHFTIAAQQVSR
jgi:Tfp pilus assembly protein PilN